MSVYYLTDYVHITLNEECIAFGLYEHWKYGRKLSIGKFILNRIELTKLIFANEKW